MVQKYCSLSEIVSGNSIIGEIRFYENPRIFQDYLKRTNYSEKGSISADICFNGEATLGEVLGDFSRSFPDAKIIDKESYVGLRVRSKDFLRLKEKFLEYFQEIKPLVVHKKSSEDFGDMTVGEYYNLFLKKR